MTKEQAQKEFDELIAKNGFTLAGHTSDTGTLIYHRVWKKTVLVAWHGEQEETLEARILLSYGYPLVTIKRNGRQDPKFIRDYSSPKRAMNAIREIVKFAGFECNALKLYTTASVSSPYRTQQKTKKRHSR